MRLDDIPVDNQIPKEEVNSIVEELSELEKENLGMSEKSGGGIDFSFLKAETGEGQIEDYLEHPLNFSHSKALARIIRGMTGIFGNLKLAIIDIVLGILEFAKEKKGATV